MAIRTKIQATLGPASSDFDTIKALAQAGADLFRVNFSHGTYDEHLKTIQTVRAVEAELGTPLALTADLCGPKIRVGKVANEPIMLKTGNMIILQREPIAGNAERVSCSFPQLIDDVQIGEQLLIDDGKLRLEVTGKTDEELQCTVKVGGELSSHKGINLPDTDLRTTALTDKDREDAKWLAPHGFDYVCISFVQQASDIMELRRLLKAEGCEARIMAKIERPQAVANINAILEVTDSIMIARGDLGVEVPAPKVPVIQKQIAKACQEAGIPCMIATQMLESMIDAPVPTRAEVSDVANAVLDHADAVMLSGETAVGQYPIQAVTAMEATVSEIQAYDDLHHPISRVRYTESPTTAAIAGAINEVIESEPIDCIAVYTDHGDTARVISRNRPTVPIIALSPHMATVRRTCLFYGVYGRKIELPDAVEPFCKLAGEHAKSLGFSQPGGRMIVICGIPMKHNSTNMIIIHTID